LVWSVAYSPDGQTLAGGSKDKTIKLWNVKTGNLLQTLTGHSDRVRSVAYSPDGQTLASGSDDNTIKLWNVKTGNLLQTVECKNGKATVLQTLTGHSELLWSVAYSPDGQTLASGSHDKTIKIWQVAASISKAPVQQTPSQVSQPPVYKPQSQPVTIPAPKTTIPVKNTNLRKLLIIAILGLIGTQVYGYQRYGVFPVDPISVIANLSSGISLEKTLTGHSRNWGSVNSVAYSPDGKTLASGSDDKTIKLWNARTGKLLQTLTGHSRNWGSVNSVAYSPDGQTLASGSDDKTIKLWNARTGKLLQTLTGHSDSVNSVAYSPDGQTLVSGSDDKTIKIWNVITGKLVKTSIHNSNWVNPVAFSPDAQIIATIGSDDNSIKIRNVSTGKLLQNLPGHSNWVNSNISKTDKDNDELLQAILGDSSWIDSLVFSPDSQTLASIGRRDGTIKIWNITTGKLIQIFSTNARSVAFSPDAQMLASGSNSGTIKIWNVITGQLLQTFPAHFNSVSFLTYSPDGQTLASIGRRDGTIKIWRLK
ncbi:WD40 repeat domain-containing protein, partial [Cuspidothrix issatschenkoi]|uniref:WD40 repeat domain-containing protein n=1 Tax=Cuspidothrix issatschenkoi TaxID=230752 RepID=UPI00105725F6